MQLRSKFIDVGTQTDLWITDPAASMNKPMMIAGESPVLTPEVHANNDAKKNQAAQHDNEGPAELAMFDKLKIDGMQAPRTSLVTPDAVSSADSEEVESGYTTPPPTRMVDFGASSPLKRHQCPPITSEFAPRRLIFDKIDEEATMCAGYIILETLKYANEEEEKLRRRQRNKSRSRLRGAVSRNIARQGVRRCLFE